ncbi:alpha/beta hydrolase [Pedobacter arcticus]|uniref:alpha/beta hydrolase n=1 Tax=Pedobacter arcticus TaxID=752140 RepID=UPI00035E8E60|nr:alpha/beta hydrolase [Pedobacter arcticus]
MKFFAIFSTLLLVTILCFSKVKKEKDIAYADKGTANLLDIYHQRNIKTQQDVIIFIHGGSWNSGKKDTYWFLGRAFARKGKVAVIINYPLSPDAKYQEMAFDCARAVTWVKQNIAKYGGNPDRIFVMGHSAGGHLAALIDADPTYFGKLGSPNPIKGVILNDPFGLDIHQYLEHQINTDDAYIPGFLKVFTSEPATWQKASPYNNIANIRNPYLMFMGGKTFESIKLQTPTFRDEMLKQGKIVSLEEIKGKKHIGMITQMIFGCNQLYDKIIRFMDKT